MRLIHTMLNLCGLFGLTLLLSLANEVAHAQSTDVIRLESESGASTSIRGTIKRMNKLNVTIESNGNERRVDVNDIRLITFGSEPRDLRSARTNIIEGRDNRAFEELSAIPENDINSDFVRWEIAFQKASAVARMALRGEDKTLAEASTALSELLAAAEFGENFHYYEAVELQGDVLMALGKFDEAERYFEELSRLPWPRMSLKATRLVANSQLRQSKFKDALSNYEKIESNALNNTEAQNQKRLAKIGRASALAGLDRADEGISILEEMIEQNSSEDKELFAQLYNALGSCYLQADKPKYAKHQYLHVHLLYNQNPDAHAEALYQLVSLWSKENNVRNSDECRELLRTRYPNSPWTAKL